MIKLKLKENKTRLWVHPAFKKLLKKEAAEKEISVVDLTKEISNLNSQSFMNYGEEKKKKFKFPL